VPEHIRIVACEPSRPAPGEDDEDVGGQLSDPVAAAVDAAADLTVSVATQLLETSGKVVER
jgi:hypothetical protein